MKRPRLLISLTAAALLLALPRPSAAQLAEEKNLDGTDIQYVVKSVTDLGDGRDDLKLARVVGWDNGRPRTVGPNYYRSDTVAHDAFQQDDIITWSRKGYSRVGADQRQRAEGHSQLVVEGVELYESKENYQKYIKYLTVPRERQRAADFRSDDISKIKKLEDPLRRQIYEAMDKCHLRQKIQFLTLDDAVNNFNMRVEAIGFMAWIGDEEYKHKQDNRYHLRFWYYDAKDPVKPVIRANPKYWMTVPWARGKRRGLMLYTRDLLPTSSYEAIMRIRDKDFRGECLSAVEVCIFYGAARALASAGPNHLLPPYVGTGPGRFDRLHPGGLYGLGLPVENEKDLSIFTHIDFMPRTSSFLVDDMIPGDWVYMKNKDDYSDRCPEGDWQGENVLYMGKYEWTSDGSRRDYKATGQPRFSGMGMPDVREDPLREALRKIYDDNTRNNKDPKLPPWRPAQLSDIRWTMLARLNTGEYKKW